MSPRAAVQIIRANGRPDVINNANFGVNVNGGVNFVLDVVDPDSIAAGVLNDGEGSRLGEPARGSRPFAVLVGISRNNRDDLQLRLLEQCFRQQSRDFNRPEILVFDVDHGARSLNRLGKGSSNASLPIRCERISGTPGWIGPKHLNDVTALRRRIVQLRREKSGDTIPRHCA